MNQKGITLIELIIFIIVGALFIPLAYIAFTSVVNNSMKPETAAQARFIAEALMEDVLSGQFDNIASNSSYPSYDNVTSSSRFASPPMPVPNPFDGYRWKRESSNVAYERDASGNLTLKIPSGWTAGTTYSAGDYIKEGNYFYRTYFPSWETQKNYAIDFFLISNSHYYRHLVQPWQTSNYQLGAYVAPTGEKNVIYRLDQILTCNQPSPSEPTWKSGTTWLQTVSDVYISFPAACIRSWEQDTIGYLTLKTNNPSPTCLSGYCQDGGKVWWKREDTSFQSSINKTDIIPNIPATPTNGQYFIDNGVRWIESTVYKQIKVYVLPPGCNSGESCEYIFTALATERNYTNRP